MLSIGTLTAGRGFYYTDLAREQYYLDGGEPPGRWHGEAARVLGFTGEVGKDQLHQVLSGFGPDGFKLVQNAGKENRQAGLDLTFSADKSVSVLWAVGDRATREAIERAHSKAVDAALDYLRQGAGWTRRGHGGTEFERCDLLFARFDHGTSRAGDPNLHTHVLVPNVGLRTDGTTAALWNKELYLHKMAAGALYRAALAYELGPYGLGYHLQADHERGLFRIASVPENVIEHFSKRRAQIEHELAEQGYSSAKAADRANLATREVKGHSARCELFPRWGTEARQLGFATVSLPGRTNEHTPPAERSLASTAREQAERLAKQRATFRPQDLLRAVSHLALDGLSPAKSILRDVRRVLAHEDTVAVHAGPRHPLLTTQTQLDREGSVLHLGATLDEKPGLTVSEDWANIVKHRCERVLDSPERQSAFDYLTMSSGNLKLLAGVAGTGKTSLLAAAREAWEKQGYRVIGMAVAGKAARELENGAGIETATVRKRQLQLEPSASERLEHHGRQLARAAVWGNAKGYQDSPMERLRFDSRTVVVIDESSMLGLKDAAQMLRLAHEAGAKVVMVGDERQLPAIDAVSPFEALGHHVGRFELSEIKRQEEDWMRDAVEAFANGDSRTGLALLKDNGALHMSKGGPSATQMQLVADWQKAACDVKDRLILTATNEDARTLNRLAQKVRLEAGEIGSVITVTLGSGESARRGDRVLFERNDRRLDVRNGELGTVVKIHRPVDANILNKGEVTIELDHGTRVRVDLNRYTDLSLGYALTTHKAQGSTVDRVFVYTTPERAARDMIYVQTSRAREEMHVYSPGHDLGEDLAELDRSLARDSESKLAITRAAASARETTLVDEERGRRQRIRDIGRTQEFER